MVRTFVTAIAGLLLGAGFSGLVGTVPPLIATALLLGGFVLLGAVAFDDYRDPPRRLRSEGHTACVFAVMGRPLAHRVNVYWVAGDDEASQFAEDLHAVAQQAGWGVSPLARLTYGGTPRDGVVFEWADGYEGAEALEALMVELQSQSVAASRSRTQGSTGSSSINVHGRPREAVRAALRRA